MGFKLYMYNREFLSWPVFRVRWWRRKLMYSPLKHGDVLNCHSSQLRLKRALKEKLQPAWSNPTCNGQHLDSADHMAGLALGALTHWILIITLWGGTIISPILQLRNRNRELSDLPKVLELGFEPWSLALRHIPNTTTVSPPVRLHHKLVMYFRLLFAANNTLCTNRISYFVWVTESIPVYLLPFFPFL